MNVAETAAELLHVALQDLHAGKADQARRLQDLAAACDDAALVGLIGEEAERAEAQAARLSSAGVDVAGPENLWMAGILDDAERDARTTRPGPLLDAALVGAIRKAKAAEIVSSETAAALARRLDLPDLLAVAEANRADEIETDRRLRERLAALTALPDPTGG